MQLFGRMLLPLLMCAASASSPRLIQPAPASEPVYKEYAPLVRKPLPRGLTIATAVVSAVAFGVGGGFAFSARAGYRDYNALIASSVGGTPVEGAALKRIEVRTQRDATVANALFITGGVTALAFALMAYFTDWVPAP